MESQTEEGSGPSFPEEPQSSECSVCRSAKGTFHYGAITCQSCKIFFLRAVSTTGPFVCDKNSVCIYPTDKCRSCRYQKCLSAGMVPKMVGLREGCARQKDLAKPSTTAASSTCTIEKSIIPIDRKNFINQTSNFFRDLTMEDIEALAESMVRTERYCDNDHHYNASINPNFEYNLDIDLAEALRNPLLICERTPIGYTKSDPVRFNYSELGQRIFCRQLLHYMDYFLACEDLWDLSIPDRIRLCSAQWSTTILTTLVYSTYKYKCDTLTFCAGYKYRPEKGASIDAHCNFVGFACDMAHRNIISIFKEVKLSDEEYAFLKKINFLTTVTRLSDHGREIVANARTKYEVAFTKYLTWKHPLTASTRLWKIMSVMPYLKILGDKNDKTTTRSVVFNTGNLSGNLAYDIHVREI